MKSRRNINFEFHKNGNRPVIVFSNSLGCELTMWDNQFNDLKDDFSILRYDVRGHGKSMPYSTDAFTIKDLALDVVDLLDELQIEKPHYCGLSIGGFLGMYLGIHYAEKFSTLTLCNTAAKLGTTEGWQLRASQVMESGLNPIADASPSRWFTEAFIASNKEIVAKTTASMRVMQKESYISCCHILGSNDFTQEITKIDLPTLIITGDSDPVTTVADGRNLYEAISNSRLEILKASHLSNIEDVTFSSRISDFIKKR